MTMTEYWEGDWYLPRLYYEAHVIAEKNKNRDLWLQGRYVFDAFSIVLKNAIAKNGAQPVPYLEKPYRIFPPTKEEQEAEFMEQVAKERAAMVAWVKNNAKQ